MRGFGIVIGVAAGVLAAGYAPAQGQAPAPADPAVVQHLRAWQQVMAGTKNFYTECNLERKHLVLKNKVSQYQGKIVCMKPNLALLRLERQPAPGDKPKPDDYMAYICNGKAVYQYDGSQKELTEYLLRAGGGVGDNLLLEFISGTLTADAILKRFEVSFFKPMDANYVYLKIVPLMAADKQEFESMILVLFRPGTARAYLPRTARMRNPNSQEEETWDFPDPRVNVGKGITEEVFQPKQPPGDWKFKRDQRAQGAAPAPPPEPRVDRPVAP